MNKIVLHHNITPANKKEAFGLVTSLTKRVRLTDDQLESLYKYFMPNTPAKAKTPEQWVALAVNPKEIREYLRYLIVRTGVMYGTDGHRIHFIPTDLLDGDYHPVTLNKVEGVPPVPNIAAIIPYTPFKAEYKLSNLVGVTADEKIEYLMLDEFRFNKKYIMQAVNGGDVVNITHHDKKDRLAPIRGCNDWGEFVIMPMRS